MKSSFDIIKKVNRNELTRNFAKELRSEGFISAQALRSASPWSIGLGEKEHSIHECYLTLIKEARYFVYIENQFFISSYRTTSMKDEKGRDDIARNRVARALYRRILQAIQHNEPFKVIIFIPLLPASEGNLEQSDKGTLTKVLVGQQNLTIALAVDSLIQSIKKLNVNYEDYIMICSLRKFEIRQQRSSKDGIDFQREPLPSTELIYIHSKVDSTYPRS